MPKIEKEENSIELSKLSQSQQPSALAWSESAQATIDQVIAIAPDLRATIDLLSDVPEFYQWLQSFSPADIEVLVRNLQELKKLSYEDALSKLATLKVNGQTFIRKLQVAAIKSGETQASIEVKQFLNEEVEGWDNRLIFQSYIDGRLDD